MRFTNIILTSLVAAGTVSVTVHGAAVAQDAAAVPQLTFTDASSASVFSQPILGWIHSTLSNVFSSTSSAVQEVQTLTKQNEYASLDKPDYSDKTIWEVIQTNEHLTDFKRILKYSGPRTKELLDDKEKKITFLVPVNWSHRRHHDKQQDLEPNALQSFDISQMSKIEQKIKDLEQNEGNLSDGQDDDKDRQHKRKVLAYIIDATVEYHVIHSSEPLKAWDVAQNSSVATALHIGNGPARKILGNLLDGKAFRLRVGKSLVPRPSAYFNFYSRLVYPDANVGGSMVHAVSLPLLIPSSLAQTLFFSQPMLAGTTSALQKSREIEFFRYPINRSAIHEEGNILGYNLQAMEKHSDHHEMPKHPGQVDVTVFAPSNLAWYRVPPLLRLFLMSPPGNRWLAKVMALHALPYAIVYADFVHSHQEDISHRRPRHESHETVSAAQLVSSSEWLWGPTSDDPAPVPLGEAHVSRYTFISALPKIQCNHSTHEAFSAGEDDKKVEFEEVDVNVYRYYILPGHRGPLQTRVSVQGVSVAFQDIAVGNGALHVIDRFIMPKHHPEKGIWADIASEAEAYGYGKVDWEAENFL